MKKFIINYNKEPGSANSFLRKKLNSETRVKHIRLCRQSAMQNNFIHILLNNQKPSNLLNKFLQVN